MRFTHSYPQQRGGQQEHVWRNGEGLKDKEERDTEAAEQKGGTGRITK